MQKDFDKWNKEKKRMQKFHVKFLAFHEREIWWCSIGLNLGDENDGKYEFYERPVLIIKKFNKRLAWILPMSSRLKNNQYFHLYNHNGETSSIIISQLRLVSVKRFRRFKAKMGRSEFNLIIKKLKQLL